MNAILKEWHDDLHRAFGFLTRVPIPQPDGSPGLARAYRVFPLAGAAIGGIIGLVYLGLLDIDLPTLGAAALALGVGILLTGALHEDGLADLADGFGGGSDIAGKLAIMHDSRLGTYGGLILIVSFTARLSALAALQHSIVLPSLIAAHALARGVLPALAGAMPYARSDGVAVTGGRPEPVTAAIAGALALAVALFALPWGVALAATLATAIAATCVALLAMWQIGGQTGDVLGAAEQVSEIAVLLLLAAVFGERALPL
jgi:adenosylcobinamide-GDP ribazoletransferase